MLRLILTVEYCPYSQICIEFNHSQLDYYTELDAVSLGGILKYPENDDIEILSIPLVTHTRSGYVYDNNEEDNQNPLSEIRVPTMTSKVLCFNLILTRLLEYNNICIFCRYQCRLVWIHF